jgi:predicted double-glycine peptidase
MGEEVKSVEVRFPEHLQQGAYSNNMLVQHTKEEFIMDFMLISQPTGTVTARVIVSPSHMKRMIEALEDNMAKYEQSFGKLEDHSDPNIPGGFEPRIIH